MNPRPEFGMRFSLNCYSGSRHATALHVVVRPSSGDPKHLRCLFPFGSQQLPRDCFHPRGNGQAAAQGNSWPSSGSGSLAPGAEDKSPGMSARPRQRRTPRKSTAPSLTSTAAPRPSPGLRRPPAASPCRARPGLALTRLLLLGLGRAPALGLRAAHSASPRLPARRALASHAARARLPWCVTHQTEGNGPSYSL